MPLASAYYRPSTVSEAQELLAGLNRVALAGGTIVNADREHTGIEVVDLQALGLAGVSSDARLNLGAMTTLSAVASDERVPETLRVVARSELPSTLRTRATIGGTVAAGASGLGDESVLAAALLAHDGTATLADGTNRSLAELFAEGLAAGDLITSISVDPSGVTAVAATGRTPADVPIVAAVARLSDGQTSVALTGVATTPILVDAADPTAGLEPPADFRGSTDYRRSLAATLTQRAMEAAS